MFDKGLVIRKLSASCHFIPIYIHCKKVRGYIDLICDRQKEASQIQCKFMSATISEGIRAQGIFFHKIEKNIGILILNIYRII